MEKIEVIRGLDSRNIPLLYSTVLEPEGNPASIQSAVFRRGCREANFTSPVTVSTQRFQCQGHYLLTLKRRGPPTR